MIYIIYTGFIESAVMSTRKKNEERRETATGRMREQERKSETCRTCAARFQTRHHNSAIWNFLNTLSLHRRAKRTKTILLSEKTVPAMRSKNMLELSVMTAMSEQQNVLELSVLVMYFLMYVLFPAIYTTRNTLRAKHPPNINTS